jgi:hypothetical protein
MSASERRPVAPEIRRIVQEASQALARLDGPRLEELALSCGALQRDLLIADAVERAEFERHARQAAIDMGIFGRILEATYGNLEVMRRLRDLREGRSEYVVPGVISEKRNGLD